LATTIFKPRAKAQNPTHSANVKAIELCVMVSTLRFDPYACMGSSPHCNLDRRAVSYGMNLLLIFLVLLLLLGGGGFYLGGPVYGGSAIGLLLLICLVVFLLGGFRTRS
jgi:hypothetical protein